MKKHVMIISIVMIMCLMIGFSDSAYMIRALGATTQKDMNELVSKANRTVGLTKRYDLAALWAVLDTVECQWGPENLAPIDGNPTSQDDLFRYLRQFYLCEIQYVILAGDEYRKFQHPEDWGYDGPWENYMPTYIFSPGSLNIWEDQYYIADEDGEPSNDYIEYTVITNELEDEEKLANERCREIADEIKYLYQNTNAVQKAQIVAEYLKGIATYNVENYEMYELLFEGEANCQAYSDTFDTIMKYLGIPCAVVNNPDYNHAWDIFYQHEITGLKVYKIDVTNRWGPALLDDTESPIFEMAYPEIRLAQLELERKILEADDWTINFAELIDRAIYRDDDGNRYMDREGKILIARPTSVPEPMPTLIPLADKVVSYEAKDYRQKNTPTPTVAVASPTPQPTKIPTPQPTKIPTTQPTKIPAPTATVTPVPSENLGVVQTPTPIPGTVSGADNNETNHKEITEKCTNNIYLDHTSLKDMDIGDTKSFVLKKDLNNDGKKEEITLTTKIKQIYKDGINDYYDSLGTLAYTVKINKKTVREGELDIMFKNGVAIDLSPEVSVKTFDVNAKDKFVELCVAEIDHYPGCMGSVSVFRHYGKQSRTMFDFETLESESGAFSTQKKNNYLQWDKQIEIPGFGLFMITADRKRNGDMVVNRIYESGFMGETSMGDRAYNSIRYSKLYKKPNGKKAIGSITPNDTMYIRKVKIDKKGNVSYVYVELDNGQAGWLKIDGEDFVSNRSGWG
ncbi:MAG: hypothetical protein K6E85_01935 [Lachnospiraceae bacterium]|nr:hypothetical protein [Lachnospiraceae bacterium]